MHGPTNLGQKAKCHQRLFLVYCLVPHAVIKFVHSTSSCSDPPLSVPPFLFFFSLHLVHFPVSTPSPFSPSSFCRYHFFPRLPLHPETSHISVRENLGTGMSRRRWLRCLWGTSLQKVLLINTSSIHAFSFSIFVAPVPRTGPKTYRSSITFVE